MDFNGIAWVGNVCHKFEAMCLEVEELIVQDAAKYVERQVQTVGNSMKKFCSDVVQDLLPDDSVVSEKPLPVSLLHEYTPVYSFKKKGESFTGKTRDVKQDQEVTEGKNNGCDYGISTSPRQYSYGGPYRRTQLGRQKLCKKEELSQVTRPSMQIDSTSLSMVHNTRLQNEVGAVKSSDSPPDEVARLGSKDEHGLTVVNSVRSQDSETRTENEQGLSVASSVRSQDSEIQPSVAISLHAGFDEKQDEDSLQTISSSVSEQKSEVLQQLSGSSVEVSCIIVDRDELHCVFPDRKENEKHKSYKKSGDAISSRMKQNREKEYKRLALQWYAEDVVDGRECETD